jgi:hypothetical protein
VTLRELVAPALTASLLGVLACAAQYAVGAGLVTLWRGRNTPVSEAVLLGYPIGLGAAAVVAAIGLAAPGGAAAAVVIPLLCAAPLLRWRPPRDAGTDLALTALVVLPGALLFGVLMGLLWHPPTTTFSAVPPGDLVYYGAKAWMLDAEPWPHRNLGLEGETSRYFNALPSALAALVLRTGGPEPQWLIAAAFPAFAVLALGLVLRAVALEGRAPRRAGTSTIGDRGQSAMLVVAVAVLAASAARYPSWIAESPPVAHAMPLVVSVTWLTWRSARRVRPLVVAGLLVVGGCLLSKVTALPALAAMVGASLLAALRRRPTGGAIGVTLLGAALVAALGADLLLRYGRLFGAIVTVGPESWRQIVSVPGSIEWSWPWLVRDLGMVASGVAGFLLGMEAGIATLVAAGIFLAVPFLFHVSQVVCCLVAASSALLLPPSPRRLALVALAAAPLLIWTVVADPGGWWAALVWLAVMMTVGGLAAAGPGRIRDALLRAGAGLAFTAVLLAAVATGRVEIDAGYAAKQPGLLTPALREVWAQVRAIVPRDALVFTDMVAGPDDVSLTGGWNTYAASGQRQLWISNWYQSEILRPDPSRVAPRLEANRAVLEGRLDPAALPLSRRYGEAWAVVRADRRVPAGWQRRFANAEWAIWRIGPMATR